VVRRHKIQSLPRAVAVELAYVAPPITASIDVVAAKSKRQERQAECSVVRASRITAGQPLREHHNANAIAITGPSITAIMVTTSLVSIPGQLANEKPQPGRLGLFNTEGLLGSGVPSVPE
jgi:hypothetical protein